MIGRGFQGFSAEGPPSWEREKKRHVISHRTENLEWYFFCSSVCVCLLIMNSRQCCQCRVVMPWLSDCNICLGLKRWSGLVASQGSTAAEGHKSHIGGRICELWVSWWTPSHSEWRGRWETRDWEKVAALSTNEEGKAKAGQSFKVVVDSNGETLDFVQSLKCKTVLS